jgi:hypothetical protein
MLTLMLLTVSVTVISTVATASCVVVVWSARMVCKAVIETSLLSVWGGGNC